MCTGSFPLYRICALAVPATGFVLFILLFAVSVLRPFNAFTRTKARLTMSYGGNIEGYLIKIDGREVRTVYCILDEGMLQYFSRKGGEQLGVLALSGSKVEAFLLPSSRLGQVHNQFRVDAQSRSSTSEVTNQWAVSILNWSRYSWDDGQIVCSSKDEYSTLQKLIELSGLNTTKATRSLVVPFGVSPAVLPL
uniref:Uncharacterized protein n=1 Tax=Peronospora matthiolae TaxID=2874970 RepID=A0AAV1UD81_9STRA